jgi:4-amino-4-deoxy-L-arabinose transferase-like glycosyltransferase
MASWRLHLQELTIHVATRALFAAQVIAAAAFVLRLFGQGPEWLPSTPRLALALALLHLAGLAVRPGTLAGVRSALSRRPFALALAAIMVVTVLVRLPGFASDLGHAPLDIDEHRLAANVKHFLVTGELLHDTVEHYPGLVFWLFSAAAFLAYVRGLTEGVALPPELLPVSTFVFASRLANIFVAAGIVWVTGLLGRRVAGPGAGLLAAAIVAIVPLSIDTTVLVRNDPGMVLAVTAAVYASLVAYDTGRWGWLLAAAMLAGAATAIKYSSMFTLVPALVAAAAHGTAGVRARRGALAFTIFVLAIAVTNHFIWFDVPNFLRQLSDQVGITGAGHYAASDNPAAFHVAILDRFGPGFPLLVLAAGFAVYSLAAWRVRYLLVLAFPLLYVWFMTQRPAQFPRWVYPLVPFAAVAGAAALTAACTWLGSLAQARQTRGARHALRAAAAILCAIVLWPPVHAGTIALSRRLVPPTHVVTVEWIAANVPAGSRMLLEQHWLDLEGLPLDVTRVQDLAAVLNEDIEALAPYEWVVVPEIHMTHPALRRLGFVKRFPGGYGFGGRHGHDYEIYAVPRLPAPQEPR